MSEAARGAGTASPCPQRRIYNIDIMGKFKDIKIVKDGVTIEKSDDNYVKVSDKKVKVSWTEGEIYFKIGRYKDEHAEVADVKFENNVLSFRYVGEFDVGSDSEDEKWENVEFKFAITFLKGGDEIAKLFKK